MIAGPSEILVIADGSTPADWVAMDLFSQAEHDELAQSILLSPDAAYLQAVQAAIVRLLPTMPRRAIIEKSLADRGFFVHTRSMEEACAISNQIAPEHLEISSTARFSSPLGVYDFQKRSSLIQVSAAGAQKLGVIASELAWGEGLPAHARAAELRLNPVPPLRSAA